jgi:thioredoxin reductase (NADPH)
VPGEDLPHVSHYREPHPHYRRRVVIVGGKNSAAEAALDLYRNGAAHVTIVHLWAGDGRLHQVLGEADIDNRIKKARSARDSTRASSRSRRTTSCSTEPTADA